VRKVGRRQIRYEGLQSRQQYPAIVAEEYPCLSCLHGDLRNPASDAL